MKKNVILFRKLKSYEDEYNVASKYFDVYDSVVDIPSNSNVIGRYSVIPYYNEVERDINKRNSKLINSLYEHNYIAEMNYVLDLEEYTPKTYFHPNDLPLKDNKYIVKGCTNSRKDMWGSKMFAPDKKKALDIYLDLVNEPYFKDQGVVFREYIPLKKISTSLNGMPFTNEWRFFFFKNKIIDYNYYWSNSDVIPKKDSISKKAISYVQEVAEIVSLKTNFFVLDIAEKLDGDWILIEINDGQMSGLSEINPEQFYSKLSKLL